MIISFPQKNVAHDIVKSKASEDKHPGKKSVRKLPVTFNLFTLRAKLETSNGKLLEAERRKIVKLEVKI